MGSKLWHVIHLSLFPITNVSISQLWTLIQWRAIAKLDNSKKMSSVYWVTHLRMRLINRADIRTTKIGNWNYQYTILVEFTDFMIVLGTQLEVMSTFISRSYRFISHVFVPTKFSEAFLRISHLKDYHIFAKRTICLHYSLIVSRVVSVFIFCSFTWWPDVQ